MENTLGQFAAAVPSPTKVPYRESFRVRYTQQTIHQAIVLKLARTISGLHALRLLLEHGFLQEQGALQRIQDELTEDVMFLCLGAINGRSPLHDEYLNAFWMEEFDKDTAIESTQKRPMTKRQRIRSFIVRESEVPGGLDPSKGVEVGRTISKSYSGYVHAAAPHIMDMYGGNPPRFHVKGQLGSPFYNDHREDLWNYFYRAILAFAASAAAFGFQNARESIIAFADSFARSAGHSYFE
jgi:hypothetical protein